MKTKSKPLSFLWGMYLMAVAMFAPGCTKAQQEDVRPAQKNEPKIHIDVKKEYDDNGNVIRYDSTYSWSWSGGDTTGLNQSFYFIHGAGNDFFGSDIFSGFGNPFFSGPQDSLTNDPFGQLFQDNFSQMERLMEEQMRMMQEMQLYFFGDPNGIKPDEENEDEKPVKKKGISL